jgi:hypothetical protein
MVLGAIVETRRTVRTAVFLQRLLAVSLAIGSMLFVLAVIVLVGEALDGHWRALIAIPVVAAVATALGSVSLSLFRGFGVPSWFMKACLAAGVCGYIFMLGFCGWLCFFAGKPEVGAASLVMLLSSLIPFVLSRQASRSPK